MKNSKAFTLIEVIIIVAILSILATVFLPVYQSYTAQGCNIVTDSNIYRNVEENTIHINEDNTISFIYKDKKVITSKFNADIICITN